MSSAAGELNAVGGSCVLQPAELPPGSVWAVEQGTIIFGLRRFGFDARALDLRAHYSSWRCCIRKIESPSAWVGMREAIA